MLTASKSGNKSTIKVEQRVGQAPRLSSCDGSVQAV
eukprot:SAG31_NODE_45511_length_258_cov_0.981132_1_plen_35_part_10